MNEDTANLFAVSVRGTDVVVLKWGRLLTVQEALNLAAWLVACSDAAALADGHNAAREQFSRLLDAVLST